jgi:hypothetical protein
MPVLRPVVSEIVQEKKRVEAFGITEPERTPKPYPCTLNRGLGSYEILDRRIDISGILLRGDAKILMPSSAIRPRCDFCHGGVAAPVVQCVILINRRPS